MPRPKRQLEDVSSDEADKIPAKRVRKISTAIKATTGSAKTITKSVKATTKSSKTVKTKRKVDANSSSDENDETSTKTVRKRKAEMEKPDVKSNKLKPTGR